MKKFLIFLLLLLVILIIFWSVEYYKKDDIYLLERKNLWMLNVEKDNFTCLITNAYHFNSWNYDYTIENGNLYLKVYRLSFFNPMTKHGWLEVKIDAGYEDFDKIYIDNGQDKEKILVWTSEDNFTFDKLINLNVQSKELMCWLDYDFWEYDYDLLNRKLVIRLSKREEKNENGLEVKIDKGYDDFDEVYIYGLGNKVLIWSKNN